MTRQKLSSQGVLVAFALVFGGCTSTPETLASVPYRQNFDGATLGPEWTTRGGGWEIVGGRLFNNGARNVPLWLSAPLPQDVKVRFKAESQSPAVDLKFEIFGNGSDHQSGYVVILSGWNNSKSIIARLDEHGPERTAAVTTTLRAEVGRDADAARIAHRLRKEIVARPHRGKQNHVYAFELVRKGHTVRLVIDGELHLEYFDPSPLGGPGHDRFAFSNWETKAFFDDLVIEAL